MDEKADQQEIEEIQRILDDIDANAYEVVKMVLALENENLHRSETMARNAVREAMVKNVEGLA